MYAGVILAIFRGCRLCFGVPRVCGGDPVAKQIQQRQKEVFPVYAGVIPVTADLFIFRACVPRVCGGDPLK